MANEFDDLIAEMATLNINAAVPVVRHGPLSDQGAALVGTGVAPGRIVYDRVTGQWVTVVGQTVAYLPEADLEEVKRGG